MNSSLFLIGLLCAFTASAQVIDIEDAAKQKIIAIEARVNDSPINGYAQSTHSGDCIELTLKNISSTHREVQLKPGQFLQPVDTTMQRMMNTLPYVFKLAPGQSITQRITAFCSQATKRAPSKEVLFTVKKKATGSLILLADYLAQKKYKSSSAQLAVWVVSDDDDVSSLSSEDPESKDLYNFLTTKLNIKPTPNRHQNSNVSANWVRTIHINMEYELETTATMRVVVLNEKEEILKLIVDQQKQTPGTYKYNTTVTTTVPATDTTTHYCIVRYYRNDIKVNENRYKMKRLE